MTDRRREHPVLARLARDLAERPGAPAGADGDPARAAVAITLRPHASDVVELLLIRRAERHGDPWSGQVALPGGRWSPNDSSLLQTALRETWEETGISLDESGLVLGTLDELRPRTSTLPPIIVTPVVVAVERTPPLVLSDEVAEAFWVDLDTLRDPAHSRESTVEVRGARWRVPSFVIGPHIVWGLTERILRELLARTG